LVGGDNAEALSVVTFPSYTRDRMCLLIRDGF
jgi:hypothetical protein